jgi:hypothetical protein
LPYPRRKTSKSAEFVPLTSAFWLWRLDCMDMNRQPAELKRKKVNMRVLEKGMALLLSWCLAFVSVGDGFAYQTGAPPLPPQAAQQSPEQLQQLVAPIALYPDSLVAQILAAATHPDEVVKAEEWMEKHKNTEPEKLAKDVNKEHWDPAVKAMTQFPAVLANMNQNLAWTSELGDAYVNQSVALNQAIQTMRQKAQQAGNLKTTPQETVTNNNKTIVIEPAQPDFVYVPQYDPWLVYGYPLAIFPGWYPYAGLSGTVRESIGDWALVLDSSPASAGAGAIGDTTGTAAGPSTTTAGTSRIATASSTVAVFARTGGISAILETFAVRRECGLAPSVGSIMAISRDPVASGASPALAVSTTEDSVAAAVFIAAGVEGSCGEVTKS